VAQAVGLDGKHDEIKVKLGTFRVVEVEPVIVPARAEADPDQAPVGEVATASTTPR
jgi:hypothetical protein